MAAARATNSRGLIPAELYWSKQGMVSCGDHAPIKGSDTWKWDRWKRITDRVVADLGGNDIDFLRCETCGKRRD